MHTHTHSCWHACHACHRLVRALEAVGPLISDADLHLTQLSLELVLHAA